MVQNVRHWLEGKEQKENVVNPRAPWWKGTPYPKTAGKLRSKLKSAPQRGCPPNLETALNRRSAERRRVKHVSFIHVPLSCSGPTRISSSPLVFSCCWRQRWSAWLGRSDGSSCPRGASPAVVRFLLQCGQLGLQIPPICSCSHSWSKDSSHCRTAHWE